VSFAQRVLLLLPKPPAGYPPGALVSLVRGSP
jgi:hypothetical protein